MRRAAIQVWGDAPRDYLSVLRHRLAETADHLCAAQAELVPLPETADATVHYEELLALEAMGERHYVASTARRRWSISELLNGRKAMNEDDEAAVRDTYNISAGNVSFGDGATNLIASSFAGLPGLGDLKIALRESNVDGRDEHLAALEEAERTGDRARLRATVLKVLDGGAKVGTIASAATIVLSHL